MRDKLFELIKPGAEETRGGKIYDVFMIVVILISITPLLFKTQNEAFFYIDKCTAGIFILDYLLRWSTADKHFGEKGLKPFLRYPFSIMAIIDMLSILPSLILVSKTLKTLRLFRLFIALRILRIFRIFRYSKNMKVLIRIFTKQKEHLIVVLVSTVAYILVSAIVIFQTEPDTFNSYFDAVYWATVSLTTVGYGDLLVVSTAGKVVAMISTFIGMGVIALPAGIITAGYMEEIRNEKEKEG